MLPEQSKPIVPPEARAVFRAATVQDVIRVGPVTAAAAPGPEPSGLEAAAAVDVPTENASSAAGTRHRSRTDDRREVRMAVAE
jgi:hypothetical protein